MGTKEGRTMSQDQKILELTQLFEQVFEDAAMSHEARLKTPVAAPSSLASLLGAARTYCVPLKQEIDADLCLQCDHFIGYHRRSDGSVILESWGYASAKPPLVSKHAGQWRRPH